MNTFGKKFRVSIFGESHGEMIGVTLDGVTPGIPLCEEDFMHDINRRKSGNKGTTPRKEADIPKIISGVFNGFTTGAPLTILFLNTNTRSADYSNLVKHPRPGHVDFVATRKYWGYGDYRGGGHFSGRITLGLVAAGVVAKKMIPGININAHIVSLGGETDKSKFETVLDKIISDGDSVGGVVECTAIGVPVGLGDPFFDSAESIISHLAFSVGGVKGIEFGAGFSAANMKGSEFNDLIVTADGKTETNNSGGINGGITNGNNVVFRVVVRPTASISIPQQTFNLENHKKEVLIVKGRHDSAIVLRMPVIMEAITAIAIADMNLFLL